MTVMLTLIESLSDDLRTGHIRNFIPNWRTWWPTRKHPLTLVTVIPKTGVVHKATSFRVSSSANYSYGLNCRPPTYVGAKLSCMSYQ